MKCNIQQANGGKTDNTRTPPSFAGNKQWLEGRSLNTKVVKLQKHLLTIFAYNKYICGNESGVVFSLSRLMLALVQHCEAI